MASVIEKRRADGRTYYYLVESARVDGKPRIVSQQYLGSAEEVMAKLSGASAGEPVRSQHKRFGDVAAVWSVLDDLDVVGLVDDVVPRYAHAGASVGTYLALATLNRIVDPCSKRAFADWWATTAGPRWVKLDDARLGSPPVLGRDGPPRRRRPGRHRDADLRRHDRPVSGWTCPVCPGHDQLRHLSSTPPTPGADRPARQGQTETRRPASGRPGPGRHPRRRDPDRLARLPRRPPGRHPVHHRPGRAGRPATGCWSTRWSR